MAAIDFEMQQQQHSNWCWAAVAVSVARYFDPDSKWCQCRLASRMAKREKLKVSGCGTCREATGVPKKCNQPWYLQKALRIVKMLKGKPKGAPLSYRKTRQLIKAGRPVCARILWGQGPDAHFVAITGCFKTKSGERWVDVEDPDSGSSTWLHEEFRKNYQYAQGQWVDTYPV
jgi:Papain-like cysteine protease AvrRpt2